MFQIPVTCPLLSLKRKKLGAGSRLLIVECEITKVDTAKFLGVYTDKNLTLTNHIKMVADKMVRINRMDKIAYGQNCIGHNCTDKMVWTKWYNYIFCVHFNSVEFNIIFSNPN